MDIDGACRMCLMSTCTKYPLFQVRMTQSTVGDGDANAERGYVFEYLQKFASISLKLNDGLPNKICVDCLNEVSNIYTFRNRCVNAQNRMQPLIESRIPFNYAEVCRTCTNSNGTLESLQSGLVFGGKAITLLEVINKFFLLTLTINIGVPDKICNECLKRVQRAISFRKKCEQSDRQIKNSLSENKKRPNRSTVNIFKKRKGNFGESDAIVVNDDGDNESRILTSGLITIQLITDKQANIAKPTDSREQPDYKSLPPLVRLNPTVNNDVAENTAESRANHSNSSIMLGTNESSFVNSRPVTIKLITQEANISKSIDVREQPYSKSLPTFISLEPVVVKDEPHGAIESTENNPHNSIMMALKEINNINSRSSTTTLITNEQISHTVEQPSPKAEIILEPFVIDINAVETPPPASIQLEEIVINNNSAELIENNCSNSIMQDIKEEPELEIVDLHVQNDYFNLLNVWPEEKNNLETILLDDEQECSNNTQLEPASPSEITTSAECSRREIVGNNSKINKPDNRTIVVPVEEANKVDLFPISQSGINVEKNPVSSDVDFDQEILATVIVKQV